MTDTKRLIVNTLSQHLRTLINIVLSLYSTRLAMDALGQTNYGVYMLIGGIVSLLLYITNSMIVTTQRHLSYSYGKGDAEQSRRIFQNSYLLHTALGLTVALAFLSITPLLFDGQFLKIEHAQLSEARCVYFIVVFGVLTTFVTSPFRALLTARENIVYISIIDVLDGVLKTALVCILYFVTEHLLTVYAIILASVIIFDFLSLALYCKLHYSEASLLPHPTTFSRAVQQQLIGFATWTLYGTMCIFLRAQGIAVIINRLYGAIMNASYGIATQVFGSVQAVSAAILNAISPQIVKAEGNGDRQRMVSLSMQACKYSFLLLALFGIPLMAEMDGILRIWLKEPPAWASMFCRAFIIASLIDQLTTGLNISIQALGQIRNYTLLLYTTKLLAVPAAWLLLREGYGVEVAMLAYVFFEAVAAYLRFLYAKRKIYLTYGMFFRTVLLRTLIPTVAMSLTCYLMTLMPDFLLRFFLTGLASVLVGAGTLWFSCFSAQEKDYVKNAVRKKIST